jgi:hypothetical protein
MEFPEPKWAVPGLIPEGLTILAGSPKVGKSWLCFALTIAIAAGGMALGQIPVEQGEVLYLSLEDPGKRLKRRLVKLLDNGRMTLPKGTIFSPKWPRFGRPGGLRRLGKFLSEHPNCRLVIIDTLAKVRNEETGSKNAYEEDYRTASAIKRVADDYGIAILIVHHLRKMGSEDIYERISGSNGLTGAADGVLILRRERGKADAVLFASGRDVEEQELAVKFDPNTATWGIIGDAAHFRISAQRKRILKALEESERAMAPQEIAQLINDPELKTANVKHLCYEMVKDGQIKNAGDGRFIALPKGAQVSVPIAMGGIAHPLTGGNSLTQTPNGVTAVKQSYPVSAVIASYRVPDNDPTNCVQCGTPLPEGWRFECPECLQRLGEQIDSE